MFKNLIGDKTNEDEEIVKQQKEILDKMHKQ